MYTLFLSIFFTLLLITSTSSLQSTTADEAARILERINKKPSVEEYEWQSITDEELSKYIQEANDQRAKDQLSINRDYTAEQHFQDIQNVLNKFKCSENKKLTSSIENLEKTLSLKLQQEPSAQFLAEACSTTTAALFSVLPWDTQEAFMKEIEEVFIKTLPPSFR
jgi:hypothetical protein